MTEEHKYVNKLKITSNFQLTVLENRKLVIKYIII